MLANLACITDNQIVIAVAGDTSVVVWAMKAYKKHSTLKQQGCFALTNLANGNADNQITIATVACISVKCVSNELRNAHPLHVGVQRRGDQVLKNLGTTDDADLQRADNF